MSPSYCLGCGHELVGRRPQTKTCKDACRKRWNKYGVADPVETATPTLVDLDAGRHSESTKLAFYEWHMVTDGDGQPLGPNRGLVVAAS